MKKYFLFLLAGGLLFSLTGCTVRTYQLTRDRVDQDLVNSGNRGYLQGTAPADTGERKTTRTTQVVEVEVRPAIKFEKMKKAPTSTTVEAPATTETTAPSESYAPETTPIETPVPTAAMEKYTVEKNDTLQKISQKFYGTTKKWNKILKANEGVIKGPNKIYPGQVINIPIEEGVQKEQPPQKIK